MSEPIDTIEDRLAEVASEPSSATSDGHSATNQPIPDLIELHRYLKGTAALPDGGTKSGWGSLRIARSTPPGAV